MVDTINKKSALRNNITPVISVMISKSSSIALDADESILYWLKSELTSELDLEFDALRSNSSCEVRALW